MITFRFGRILFDRALFPQRQNASSATAHARSFVWLSWCLLALIMIGAVLLHLPASHWLSDAAASADFSFHPDDERFVLAARDIKAPNPDGYPQGMTTQLFLAHGLISRCTAAGLLEVLHGITIFYSGLSMLLVYLVARTWQIRRGAALLGAAFLAVAPLVVVQSNFGTADVTAMFYFYATLLAGGQYLRTRKQLWFITFCTLSGMALAVKFFIPLMVPLALVLAAQPKGRRLAQALTALLAVTASFEALSLFKYTPWDLYHLFLMLRDDNFMFPGVVSDIVASGPIDQLRRYSWDIVSAVGIPSALLLMIGIVRWFGWSREIAQPFRGVVTNEGWRTQVTPGSLFVAALSTQAALILISRIHAERHALVFVPVACIAAAQTLFEMFESGRLATSARVAIITLILACQSYEAMAVESLYPADIRNDMASWAAEKATAGVRVISMAPFSHVRGTTYIPQQNPVSLDRSDYIVTCDFEYARYLHHKDASEIFHPMGGQVRLDFFRGVFEEGSDFGVVREFRSAPRGLELRLIDAQLMAPLGTFVPRHCFALGRVDALPPEAQRAMRAEVATAERGW